MTWDLGYPPIGASKGGGARDTSHLGVQILSFSCSFRQKNCKTRMHSSRMHTVRLLPVSPSMHCLWKGVGVSEGGTWSQGVCLVLGIYLVQGVYLVPGMYLVLEGCTWSRDGWCTCPGTPPPPVNRMTDRQV